MLHHTTHDKCVVRSSHTFINCTCAALPACLPPALQIRSFEVHDLPVRVAKFIERKNWIVCGSVRCNCIQLPWSLTHSHCC